MADDFVRERDALRQTLLDVGPDAPTACGDWTTTELAIHLAVGELRGGWPTAPFRMLVNRGIRVDRTAPVNVGAVRLYRRRGFDWAIRRLGRKPPRAHMLRSVVRVSLLEVWGHHEDVLLANGGTCDSGIDVQPIVDVLLRYQRKSLTGVDLAGSPADVARRLAGRGDASDLRV